MPHIGTYSPVIKPQTIKLVLCTALSHGWPLRQMDVNNAFLHGSISEHIYMSQPTGFVNSYFPDYVCKLHKALYGLKQAPSSWYNALKDFLITMNFLILDLTLLYLYTIGMVLSHIFLFM